MRTYQLPNWHYFGSPLLHPYRLASMGYGCSGPLTLTCHMTLHTVTLSENCEDNLEEVEAKLSKGCFYYRGDTRELKESDIYIGLSDIV